MCSSHAGSSAIPAPCSTNTSSLGSIFTNGGTVGRTDGAGGSSGKFICSGNCFSHSWCPGSVREMCVQPVNRCAGTVGHAVRREKSKSKQSMDE